MSKGVLGGPGALSRWRRERTGAVVAAVLLVTAVVLALVGGGGDDDASVAAGARPVEVSELRDAEATLGHPLYWAGPQPGRDLELEVEGAGNAFLRYVPQGEAGGTLDLASYLTVGTYPVPEALGALRRSARAAGFSLRAVEGGGLVLVDPEAKGSAYLAYPDSDLQIEVYDPALGKAVRLIESGMIRPVG
jgi:hypothetical protein